MMTAQTSVSRPNGVAAIRNSIVTCGKWLAAQSLDLLTSAPITVSVFLLTVWIQWSPAAAALLQFDQVSIAHFQWWRVLTGHLTHWSADHWMWDAAMFLLLGAMCEARIPWRYVACLLISAFGISAVLLVAMPDVGQYRGLSGIDTALFTLLAFDILLGALKERRHALTFLIAALLVGLVSKVGYEVATGATLFVDSASTFVPLPGVHFVGALLGPTVLLSGTVPVWKKLTLCLRAAGRFLRRPIGWPMHAMVVLASILMCWGARLPGGDWSYLLVGLLLWIGVVVLWFARFALRLAILVWRRDAAESLLRGWTAWVIAPVVLTLTCVVIAHGVPFRIAFRVSKPSLDRLANRAIADGKTRDKQWAGVIPIGRVQMKTGRVEMEFNKDELLWGKRGLYFSPEGNPVKDTYYYSQRPIRSGWYIWHHGGW